MPTDLKWDGTMFYQRFNTCFFPSKMFLELSHAIWNVISCFSICEHLLHSLCALHCETVVSFNRTPHFRPRLWLLHVLCELYGAKSPDYVFPSYLEDVHRLFEMIKCFTVLKSNIFTVPLTAHSLLKMAQWRREAQWSSTVCGNIGFLCWCPSFLRLWDSSASCAHHRKLIHLLVNLSSTLYMF